MDADLLFHRAKKAGARHSNDPGRLHIVPAILLQNREERQNAIETYIQDILDKRGYHKSRRLQEFFEISRVSFVKELGVKRRLVDVFLYFPVSIISLIILGRRYSINHFAALAGEAPRQKVNHVETSNFYYKGKVYY